MSRQRGRENLGSKDEEEEEIVYRIRMTRNRTTYEDRERCALGPGQMMEQNSYYIFCP